ncbi:ABC transporter substrate-binding protein [Streptomyces synnematoformans]|uniref:ABC transporter substrate-binding protein n=1 Tax=Streptomyces synnematoformans TaxID=415721 RepID=A0ABN2YFP4_9ACTN
MSRLSRPAALTLSTAASLALLAAGCSGDGGSSGLPADQESSSFSAEGDGVRLGILGQCEGPFGGFHEDVVAGTTLAFARYAGASPNSSTSALEGFSDAEVAGTPIELVGIGCGDDTADRILQEVRRLVEQQGANVIIGPLSGDEGIAVAEYAKGKPDLTVFAGISGSQEQTLQVQAPNYFRFYGDGAIWNAGLGDLLYREKGWRKVAVIADDYSFGHTSAAGFVADFCGVGGEVTHRVFPPLGTTDYSSYIAQLPDPDEVDGYFWAVGGTGTQAALEAFVNAKGDLTGDRHAGNFFFNPDLAQALGTDIAGAHIGGFATLPGDIQTPEIKEYLAAADETWETIPGSLSGNEPAPPSTSAAFGFFYGYYSAGVALVEGLKAVDGDISDPKAFQSAVAGLTLDLPHGDISLDENRSGIVDVGLSRLAVNDSDEVVQESVAIVPGVDQTFGGTFSPDTPSPGRDFPKCEKRDLPWEGKAIPVVDGVPQR